jgi:hypothetical protein
VQIRTVPRTVNPRRIQAGSLWRITENHRVKPRKRQEIYHSRQLNRTGDFQKRVFNDSYQEYLIQIQSFDPGKKYKTWDKLREAIPKANLNVQYKTGFAIGEYVKNLANKIPDLTDNLGHSPFLFARHEFEIISSDVENLSNHKVAITYFTDLITLVDCFGEYVVLAASENSKVSSAACIETTTLKMQHNLSISQWEDMRCPLPGFDECKNPDRRRRSPRHNTITGVV